MYDRLRPLRQEPAHSMAASVSDLPALERIFDVDCHLVRLPRAIPAALADYLDNPATHAALRALPRKSLSSGDTFDAASLPAHPGRRDLLDDVRLCGELLCDLTGSLRFGARIEVLDRAMCPRWHVDHVSLRLLVTWRGPATEWLDEDGFDRSLLGSEDMPVDPARLRQAAAGDILLLKGERWPRNAGRGVIHRSPCVEGTAPRVVAAFDALC